MRLRFLGICSNASCGNLFIISMIVSFLHFCPRPYMLTRPDISVYLRGLCHIRTAFTIHFPVAFADRFCAIFTALSLSSIFPGATFPLFFPNISAAFVVAFYQSHETLGNSSLVSLHTSPTLPPLPPLPLPLSLPLPHFGVASFSVSGKCN